MNAYLYCFRIKVRSLISSPKEFTTSSRSSGSLISPLCSFDTKGKLSLAFDRISSITVSLSETSFDLGLSFSRSVSNVF